MLNQSLIFTTARAAMIDAAFAGGNNGAADHYRDATIASLNDEGESLDYATTKFELALHDKDLISAANWQFILCAMRLKENQTTAALRAMAHVADLSADYMDQQADLAA